MAIRHQDTTTLTNIVLQLLNLPTLKIHLVHQYAPSTPQYLDLLPTSYLID